MIPKYTPVIATANISSTYVSVLAKEPAVILGAWGIRQPMYATRTDQLPPKGER